MTEVLIGAGLLGVITLVVMVYLILKIDRLETEVWEKEAINIRLVQQLQELKRGAL